MEVVIKIQVNTENNEVKLISAESAESVQIKQPKQRKQTTKSSKPSKNASSSGLPEVILEDNRLVFTDEALELLGLEEGEKVHIKYNQKEGVKTPIIGLNTEFGVKAGNVLNKNKTVSWRGQKNEQLAEYGEVFILEPFDNKDGSALFALVDENEADTDNTSKPSVGINISLDKNVKPIDDKEEVDLDLPSDIEIDPNSDVVDMDDLEGILDDVDIIDLDDLSI